MKKTTIICVMALLCPRKLKVQSRKREGETFLQGLWSPKLKAYLLLPLLICLNICGKAQTKEKPSPSTEKNSSLSFGEGWGGALKVGDKVPESFWQQEHDIYQNGKSSKQTLADYKGKLLLLDFWATWCSTCYHKFPYLDSLSNASAESLGIMMVNTIHTKDDIAKIKTSLNKYARGKPFRLPSIYNDEYLVKLFPHGMLSHYVWINKLGIVVAFTGSDFINDTNINLSIARFAKP